MRAAARARLQGLADRARDLVVADRAGRPGARLVVKAVKATVCEAVAPRPGGRRADPDLGRNRLVVEPVGRSQHDPRPRSQRLRRSLLARQRRQFPPLHIIENDRNSPTLAHFRPTRTRNGKNVTKIPIRTLGGGPILTTA